MRVEAAKVVLTREHCHEGLVALHLGDRPVSIFALEDTHRSWRCL